MTDLAPTVSAILGIPAPRGAQGRPIAAMVADLTGRERVVVVVPDGLGMITWRKFGEEMPFLSSLHAERSLALRSVLPSITPVNFATMLTGTDLASHGVASFRHDFACESLFEVLRGAGKKSAGIGIHGYTGAELLGRFADVCGDAGDGSDDDVVANIEEVIEVEMPDFVIAQLGRVDDELHRYGPLSPELVPMLRATDARLERLAHRLASLDYGLIVTADHGHHEVAALEPGGKLGDHGTESDDDCLVPCTWS